MTDILNELKNLSEESYKEFNVKIIPTSQNVLGVRLPLLRQVAKRIAKENPLEFIASDKQNVYEMVMLEGLVLAALKEPFVDLLPQIEDFLAKIDNWGHIDSVFGSFKSIKKDPEGVMQVVLKWLESEHEFVVRAALVILLGYYVEEKYLNTVFRLSQQVTHKAYYVHMANSWLISVCMAKYPEQTIEFFKANTLDAKTHNKAIQKSRESFRVSQEHKDLLLVLKK